MKRRALPIVCWLLLLNACSFALAKDPNGTAKTAVAMTEAAKKFLATLNAEELAKTTMSFDDPRRLDWNNIPKPMRKGFQFKEMNDEQKKLCLALIKSALSETGFDKAQKIWSLENNLLEGEKDLKDAPLRDPQRYFLTIFGKPDSSGSWGWSFEGHHFSQNFVIRDSQVVCDTPSFWGANPATVNIFVNGGPEKGTRTLAKEEQSAFELVNALDDTQKKKAIIAEKPPKEYRAAGEPQPPHTAPEGIAAAELTDAQKKQLRQLLETYCGNLADDLAATRIAEIEAAGLDKVYFAWLGATKPGVGHDFRVQGPTFVLELINIQNDPAGNPANHIHSVWRSMKGDFAVKGE